MTSSMFKSLLLSGCLFFVSAIHAEQTESEQTVMAFVTAFNEKNVGKMLSLATENIKWMSIAGDNVAIEASGADHLKSAMQDYFASQPDSHAKIRQIQSSGSWVTTLEHAGRDIDGKFTGQCAYAMYHLNDGLIESVWYFPAHNCDQD